MTREDIFTYIKNKHNVSPEFLWQKYPNYAIFRCPSNKKWFAILMDVQKQKLGIDGNEKIDILNVKCDPFLIDILCTKKEFLPAYHMNKNSWITILLNETCNIEEIFEIIDHSYEIVNKK